MMGSVDKMCEFINSKEKQQETKDNPETKETIDIMVEEEVKETAEAVNPAVTEEETAETVPTEDAAATEDEKTEPTTEELSKKVDEIVSTEPTTDNLTEQIEKAEKVEKELEKKIEETEEKLKEKGEYFNPHAFSNFWNGVSNGWDN